VFGVLTGTYKGGGIFNHFDGSVDLLDDLDDHYTARTHKKERNHLIERLQGVCSQHSVRITILGGDVHLAALGRFYSNPKLGIATENDPRYMANVVSSAITNKPPPQAIANLLARRNRIHHLDLSTDETLFKLFDKDPGKSSKTAGHNHVTMPSRNYAVITENSPANRPGGANNNSNVADDDNPASDNDNNASDRANGNLTVPAGDEATRRPTSVRSATKAAFPGKDGHSCLHAGEVDGGTRHKAADPARHGRGTDGGLDICIKVEMDQHDRQGRTESYGLTVPALEYRKTEAVASAKGPVAAGLMRLRPATADPDTRQAAVAQ